LGKKVGVPGGGAPQATTQQKKFCDNERRLVKARHTFKLLGVGKKNARIFVFIAGIANWKWSDFWEKEAEVGRAHYLQGVIELSGVNEYPK